MDYKCTETAATIDWSTFTSRNPRGQGTLYDAYNAMAVHADSTEERDWRWNGYRGRYVPGLACGARDDGTILRASGDWANDLVWILPQSRNIRPSRVDLQVTIRLEEDVPDLAKQVYDHKGKYSAGRRRVPTFTLYQNDDNGGQTLYAGSRKSPRMIRLYDKWRESGDDQWRNCWRYEVELKNSNKAPWARSWWAGICDEKWSLSDTQAIVHQHSEAMCIPALFPPSGGKQMVLTRARATTADQTLEWFRAQVSPAAAKLIEAGRIEDVLHSLFPAISTRQKVAERARTILATDGEWGDDQDIIGGAYKILDVEYELLQTNEAAR